VEQNRQSLGKTGNWWGALMTGNKEGTMGKGGKWVIQTLSKKGGNDTRTSTHWGILVRK